NNSYKKCKCPFFDSLYYVTFASNCLNANRKASIASCYNERGLINYKNIDFLEAINDYTKAIEYETTMAVAYYNRAVVNYRMGCFGHAFSDMQTAVNLDPNNAEFQIGFQETRKAMKEPN
ncbi:Tetratricopeptide repeat protein 32-like protein, partial [Dinothrombium tinctorium]